MSFVAPQLGTPLFLPALQAKELNQRLKDRSITLELTGAPSPAADVQQAGRPGCIPPSCQAGMHPSVPALCCCRDTCCPPISPLSRDPALACSQTHTIAPPPPFADAALDYAVAQSYDHLYGARPLRRWLEHSIITPLSRMIITGALAVCDKCVGVCGVCLARGPQG